MKIRNFLVLTAILFLLYSGIWYYFASILENHVNNNERFYSNDKYTRKFDKVSKSGFPFRIELSCEGLVEIADSVELSSPKGKNNITTTYSSPIYIGYSILSRNFYLNYNGEALSESDDKEYGDNMTINTSLYAGYGFFDFVSLIFGKTENILDRISHITVKLDNLLVKDIKTEKQFINIEDFVIYINQVKSDKEDDIKLAISSEGRMHKSEITNGIFAGSYLKPFALPEYKYDFEGTISIPKQLNKSHNMSGVEIDISKWTDTMPFVQSQVQWKLVVPKNLSSNESFIFQYNGVSKMENGILGFLANYLKEDLDEDKDFRDNIANIISKYQDPKKLDMLIDMSISMEPLNFKMNNLTIMLDDSGISSRGTISGSDSGYEGILSIAIYQYERIVDFIINESMEILDKDSAIKNYHDLYYAAYVKTLKFVSENSDSDSKNIEFDIAYQDNNFKIGKYILQDFWKIFYQNLYNEAIPTLSDKQNIKEEILNIIPDLKDQPDLLDSLMKNSGN